MRFIYRFDQANEYRLCDTLNPYNSTSVFDQSHVTFNIPKIPYIIEPIIQKKTLDAYSFKAGLAQIIIWYGIPHPFNFLPRGCAFIKLGEMFYSLLQGACLN